MLKWTLDKKYFFVDIGLEP